jgi:radical SAM protein with 4Fe4S-binding SPASM domain
MADQGLVKAYAKPPILAGYTYDPQDAYKARDENRLLAIRVETNRSCNLRCRYCYAGSGEHLATQLGLDTLQRVIVQAAELGARSIVVIGGGEPTLHPRFRELIQFIHDHGMIPMVFTNGLNVTPELAEFLYRNDASVMGKCDSLKPQIQDYLAGQDGAFERIRAGIDNLIAAGFTNVPDPHKLRLGVSFVSCRLNLPETEAIWSYCRENHIFPNMEILTPTGRAKETLGDQYLTPEEIREHKLHLLDVDRQRFGYDWLVYTPLVASGCLQHLYSLYITMEGNVRPCAPTKFDEHPTFRQDGVYPYNAFRRPLAEIYNDPLFRYVRTIDRRVEGRCQDCEHLDECIGCRGYAYAVGVNEGQGPLKALRSGCRQCFKPSPDASIPA